MVTLSQENTLALHMAQAAYCALYSHGDVPHQYFFEASQHIPPCKEHDGYERIRVRMAQGTGITHLCFRCDISTTKKGKLLPGRAFHRTSRGRDMVWTFYSQGGKLIARSENSPMK